MNQNFTIGDSGYEPIPTGNYQGTFNGIEEITGNYGQDYKWSFTLDDGRNLTAFCPAKSPTVKNKFGKFLAAIAKQPLKAGVVVNPEDYIGQRYMLIIQPHPTPSNPDNTRLEMFSMID